MAIDYFRSLLNSNDNEEDEKVSELSGKVKTMYGANDNNPFAEINKKYSSPYANYDNLTTGKAEANNSQKYMNNMLGGNLQNYSNNNVEDMLNKTYVKSRERRYTRNPNNMLNILNFSYEEDKNVYDPSASTSNETETPTVEFNANVDTGSLGNMDVTTELPKLNTNQIKDIISTYFSKSSVITPSDAEGIYKAQQNTGMSALAILGIGALESGYGTSNIAKKKGNIWGWGATNKNPMGNAKTFSQMSQGASEFANAYLKTYYNGYGAKSINSAGTGNNPSKKGYAYNDDGTINASWARNVANIMGKFYETAKKSATTNNQTNNQNTNSNFSNKVGTKIADVSGYNNSAAKGQCVWYVRGRMKQKFGKETGALGNGNQMWYNAKKSAKLAPTEANIKPNTIASYKTGLSAAGKKYGHVIYIEDVVGDTVYYTEGGSYYYNNGTIGTLKKASKKEILNGSPKFGYGLIGFIDAENY